jgi:[acyl-carrier-protein] S-malonyltransferase
MKIAMVFPGQGSQSVGMLADLAAQYPQIEQTFAEASSILNYDLWRLVQHGPAEELDKTVHTQPALLAASYAVWRILQTRDIQHAPIALAGHSLGEYTALVCAQALQFTDAIKLVAARGQFMQEAVAPGVGAMAAIVGLDEAAVTAICQQAVTKQEILTPANFNSIGQIVIAGHKTAVERAIPLAKEKGAKLAVIIPVSVPSHCALMHPAAERLAQVLANIAIQVPVTPVLSNIDATPYTSAAAIREGLTKQLYMPVRWVEIIQQLVKMDVTQIIECGPGKVLTGLNKRIDKNLQLITTNELLRS